MNNAYRDQIDQALREQQREKDEASRSPPRFDNVSCSQCGEMFGPGNSGYSHCRDHKHRTPVDV